MNIAILGYAGQGKSAYEYWSAQQHHITICDENTDIEIPKNCDQQLGTDYLKDLDRFDLLIRTPALHPQKIVATNPQSQNILSKVTTVTDEFFRVCPAPIIGITGTKGKGTTSTLIARILKQAGYTIHLGGNIGIPPLDLLKNKIKPTDYVVLELANFQLIDLHHSPAIGVCLMVAAEHLDWHTDLDEYVTAKQQLFRWQHTSQLAVYNSRNKLSERIVSVSPSQKLPYEVPQHNTKPVIKSSARVDGTAIYMDDTFVCDTKQVALRGRHNLENVCAAIAATWGLIDHKAEVVEQVVQDFTGLEHRLEKINSTDNITYIDDSFGTTPETAVVAIESFPEPKILIAGGHDKGGDYRLMANAIIDNNVKAVIIIGKTGKKIAKYLKQRGYDRVIEGGVTMSEIVHQARDQAHEGDVVLLSTGSASFGMFSNYKDRGNKFKLAVHELQKNSSAG